MDSHDAILEQLRRAQTRGLEAITNRLDFVVESLDELVKEAKNAVREAIPSEAEQVLPLDEVSETVIALGRRTVIAEARVAELEARISELETVAVPPTASGFDREALRTLDAARSQSDLLRELLPRLADHVARAVVLVVRSGRISAWSGIGFADGERLRAWNAEVVASPLLARFATEAVPLRFDPAGDPVLAEWLSGEPRAIEAALIPVCLRGKMMGGLYIDRLADRPWNPEGAQSMVALTCWMIDTLHHRQVVPAPMLADFIDLYDIAESTEDLGATAVAGPAFAAEPEYEPAPVSVPEAVADEPAEPALSPQQPEPEYQPEVEAEYQPEAEAEPEYQPEPGEARRYEEGETEPEFDPSATMRVEVGDMVTTTPMPVLRPEPEVEPEPEPEAEPTVTEAPEPAVLQQPPPVAPVVPPVTPPPPAAASGLAPEDEARHEEARRFARLLVSEIKLYNEDEVERGRVNRDLYKRLKEDIDRSREMYEKRIPSEVRQVKDYFHAELVRILADGDGDVLGM